MVLTLGDIDGQQGSYKDSEDYHGVRGKKHMLTRGVGTASYATTGKWEKPKIGVTHAMAGLAASLQARRGKEKRLATRFGFRSRRKGPSWNLNWTCPSSGPASLSPIEAIDKQSAAFKPSAGATQDELAEVATIQDQFHSWRTASTGMSHA